MAKLKGLGALNRRIEQLKDAAEETQEALEEKRDWWNSKPESWKEGEKGREWEEHLNRVERTLDQIANLEVTSED